MCTNHSYALCQMVDKSYPLTIPINTQHHFRSSRNDFQFLWCRFSASNPLLGFFFGFVPVLHFLCFVHRGKNPLDSIEISADLIKTRIIFFCYTLWFFLLTYDFEQIEKGSLFKGINVRCNLVTLISINHNFQAILVIQLHTSKRRKTYCYVQIIFHYSIIFRVS